MASFAQFGNDLHTGKLSYDFVGKTKIWYSIAVAMILIAIFVPMLRGGFVFGIEFRGGSQFEVSQANNLDTKFAQDSVLAVAPGVDPRVTHRRRPRRAHPDRPAQQRPERCGTLRRWRRPTRCRSRR